MVGLSATEYLEEQPHERLMEAERWLLARVERQQRLAVALAELAGFVAAPAYSAVVEGLQLAWPSSGWHQGRRQSSPQVRPAFVVALPFAVVASPFALADSGAGLHLRELSLGQWIRQTQAEQ